MSGFLHGIETIEVKDGNVTIQAVRSGVIALVGTAPKSFGQTKLIKSLEEGRKVFGEHNAWSSFTIPQALEAIYAQGSALVVVMNVLQEGFLREESQEVELESQDFGKRSFNTASFDILISITSVETGENYVKDKDYIQNFNTINIIKSSSATDIKFSVVYSVIEWGNFDITDQVKNAFEEMDIYNKYGFNPKILIAPTFSFDKMIGDIMLKKAEKFRGICLLDIDEGYTVDDIFQLRTDTSASFSTSSRRGLLLAPMLEDPNEYRSFSSYLAGIIAENDRVNGFWTSPSNKEIKGVIGTEMDFTGDLSDPNGEINLLNSIGVITVFNAFGTGLRTWGNRSAAFPSFTDPTCFISVLRTKDVIEESIERASLQFVDRPVNSAFIDSVLGSINAFLRTLIKDGAIVDGKAWFDQAQNPISELANGHVVFDYDFMPPTPAERITFRSKININYLKTLFE